MTQNNKEGIEEIDNRIEIFRKTLIEYPYANECSRGMDVDELIRICKLKGSLSKEKEMLDREKNMQCLKCGKSLQIEKLWMVIHIHLCKDCRIIELQKLKGDKLI